MFDISTDLLFWDVLISLIGFAFFLYGKKRPDGVALVTGLVLMIYPYLVDSLAWSIGIGLGTLAAFIFVKRVVKP